MDLDLDDLLDDNYDSKSKNKKGKDYTGLWLVV